ncbi:MAG: septum formation initiator family protein [Lachnospiraceae bacterium]|nr:septum formation initiator family protein [Lachnospiraceae bacterium]
MGNIKQQTKAIRQKKRVQHHKRSILLISTVLLLLILVVSINGISLQAKNKVFKQQETELQAQIDKEKNRANEMDEYKNYVESKEYIEDIAKDKLGLVYPNEIIFKPQN